MTVLLTGATGFVGMELLARLLDRGERVACLVRGADPRVRLDAVLDTMGVPAEQRGRAVAVPGDVTAPLPAVPDVDVVVHCAASVSFGLDLDEARAINVDGTRHVLDAADRADARYVHVSTAYVAGQRSGVFSEDDRDRGQDFRNTYEQSKLEAETLVTERRPDAVILRPSIVVGESDTGWTAAFNVLYWPLRAFDRGLLPAIPARAGAHVDVVPVDYVADAIAHVVLDRPDVTGTLHLVAGSDALTAGDLLDLACDALGRPRPPLVDPDLAGGGLAERSAEAARYLPYFAMDVRFDDARAKEIFGEAGLRPPPLEDYFGRLVHYARAARWGKRPFPRGDLPLAA